MRGEQGPRRLVVGRRPPAVALMAIREAGGYPPMETRVRDRAGVRRGQDRAAADVPEMAIGISASAGLVTVDVRAFAGDLGIHAYSSEGVLDGQWAGSQSPAGSVVCPTSIR